MKEFLSRISEKFKNKREQREKEKEQKALDPNHIQLSGELPKAGSIYKWIEPVCITVGRVVSAQPDRMVFAPFADDPKDAERQFELYMENGTLYYKASHSTHEIPVDSVKRQFEFHVTTEEKTAILQDMIDYQEKVVIPKKEKELSFFKERLDLFVSLKEESQA